MKIKNKFRQTSVSNTTRHFYFIKTTLIFLFFVQLICAQGEFEKIYGSSGHDFGNYGIQTTDGGYIIAGSTDSYGAGNTDGYLIKTNSSGDTLWTKTFGSSSYDYFFTVGQTVDGGYLAGGYTTGFGFGSDDFYVVKTDSMGNLLWSRTYGGTSIDDLTKLVVTSDGGCLLAGSTGSFGAGNLDFYVVRINASGDTVWSKIFGSQASESLSFASATADDGFLLVGKVYDNQTFDTDIYLLKLNSNGGAAWVQSIGRTPPETTTDIGYAAIQTSDNGFLVAGQTQLGTTDNGIVLIKLDPSGTNIEWSKEYGGMSTENCLDVKQTSDSGFVIVGSTYSTNNGNSDNYIFKTDKNGNLLWTKSFGYVYDNDEARSVYPTSDGGFLLTGYATGLVGFSSPDVVMIKTNAQGESCNEISISFSSENIDMTIANEFTLTGSQCFISTPVTIIGSGSNTTTLCTTMAVNDENQLVENFSLSQNYPNPFNPSTTIQFSIPDESFVKLEVFNILGEIIATLVSEELSAGSYKFNWNAAKLSSGTYYYKLSAGTFTETKKLVLLK